MESREKSNVDFYNKIWIEEWQDMERLNPTARHLERMNVNLIKRGSPIRDILDIGCGMGVNIRRIRRYFPDMAITGTDLSKEILDIAKEYVGDDPKTEYAALDVGKDTLKWQFDLVLCSQVLEHIEDDVAAIKNMTVMCRKYLLITVPGGAYNSTSKLVGHHRHYKKKEIAEKVTLNGFNIIYIREWGFPFHSLYKLALDILPPESQKRIGFGRYGFFKKMISNILYMLFFGNLFDKGANVILLAEKK